MTERPMMKLRLRLLTPLAVALTCVGAAGLWSLHVQSGWREVEQTELTRQLQQERAIRDAQHAIARQTDLRPEVGRSKLVDHEAYLTQETEVKRELSALQVDQPSPLVELLQTALSQHQQLGHDQRRQAGPGQSAELLQTLRQVDQLAQSLHHERMAQLTTDRTRGQRLLWVSLIGLLVLVGEVLLVVLSRTVEVPIDEALRVARRIVDDLSPELDDLPTSNITQLIETMCSIHDEVNEQRKQMRSEEVRLFAEQRQIAQSAQQRVEFLSAITHELRTPLNGVLGGLQLLRQMGLSDQQLQIAEVAEASGHHLLGLINDVSDLSDSSTGSLMVEEAPLDLAQLILDVVALAQPDAICKGLQITTALNGLDEVTILGDRERLQQILENLIDNAIKYTVMGEVRVRATGTETAGKLHVQIEINDTGVGIEAHHIDHIFDCLTTTDGYLGRGGNNAGLGLALCRELVALMHGHIDVQSEVGVGSTFSVQIDFPLFVDCGVNILIVEDLPVSQAVLYQLLRTLGHDAKIVGDGLIAKAMLETGAFDLVFLDMDVPGMSGLDIARWASQTGLSSSLRMVAVTANNEPSDRAACLAAGMHDYLAKPVRHHELRATLERWLPHHQSMAS
ncbi:MAG: signal transduction histidine kinase/ActR/RegA family two-component response regulator [Kiritimatiellia bacterium]|jgi:signal transduction histidine kinase/ActR/RegA family two-component response regulator